MAELLSRNDLLEMAKRDRRMWLERPMSGRRADLRHVRHGRANRTSALPRLSPKADSLGPTPVGRSRWPQGRSVFAHERFGSYKPFPKEP